MKKIQIIYRLVLLAMSLVSSVSLAGSFLKSTVYPVTPDMSQMQAVENALLILQKEAIQETGVLVQQVLEIEKTEHLELTQENIQQLASAVTLTRIVSQAFDGQDLFLTAEIQVDDSHIFNSLTHLKNVTLAEEKVDQIKAELARQQQARELAEQKLFKKQRQTEQQRAEIRQLKAQVALLERLNQQALQESRRLERAESQSQKLKRNVDHRISKQQKQFSSDVGFFQRAWAHGMTIKDARQFHRFVHKPFFSEADKKTVSFMDASYRERFNESRHDTYVVQQTYINNQMTYLLAVTHKGHGRIKNIYVAREIERNQKDQIKVTSVPLMQVDLAELMRDTNNLSYGKNQRF